MGGRLFSGALAVVLGLAFALCPAAVAPARAQADKRVALVIGNAAYKEAPLKNPVNDARLMAAKLRELGFEVIARENATLAQIGAAVAEFAGKLTPDTAALIYYAGHGVQSRGRNYLIPVDISPNNETELGFQAIDVSRLTDELERAQARVSFLILDACRNNPFERRLRGAARGLSVVDAARGALIAYATAPGSVAADGAGANGPYTEELAKALAVPNLKAEEVFKRVTAAVEARTGGQQTPWTSSSLRGDFIFNLTINVLPAAPAPQNSDAELLFWKSAEAGNRAEEYTAYLQQYPRGVFADLARVRIAKLTGAPPPPPPAPAATARPAGPAMALEPIDREYIIRETARVREAPDLGARVVATLREGEAVLVLGKVKDQGWYKIERAGAPLGFVATALVEEPAAYSRRKAEEERQQQASMTPAAPPPPAQPEPPATRRIEGLYRVTGTNTNGTTYSGTCRIARVDDEYEFVWSVGNTYRGTGDFQGDRLVIDWGQRYPVIYEVMDDGRLVGTWNNGAASEVLERF